MRALTYLNLYGFKVDMVLANRLLRRARDFAQVDGIALINRAIAIKTGCLAMLEHLNDHPGERT